MQTSRILAATALVAAFAVSTAYAQHRQAQRLSGTIEKVEGNTITGKARDGAAITLKLPDNVVVTAVLPATAADIKPGAYIGSGAVPQADGSQKAVEVHIFAESQRGQGDGHRPGWYGAPNGTMTNGAVEPTGTVGAASTSGGDPVFVVKYKEGDKRIVVLGGEPIGAVLRVPPPGELRANFATGGSPAAAPITARDREICRRLAPHLDALGLWLVGIDVIGSKLTEVNVTSPTGLVEIDALIGESLEAKVIDFALRRAGLRRARAAGM